MKRSRNVDLFEVLIREILLRLPVKSLLRCKCVCKQWCALIGSQSFINSHFDHESNRDCLLIQPFPISSQRRGMDLAMFTYTDDGRHSAIDYLSEMPFDDHVYLLGPAKGVFCLVDSKHGCQALFNLATRKFKPLPPIPLPRLMSHIQFVFGFDSFSGDFKVIAFQPELKSRNYFCVYSSSSDSWSKSEVVDWLIHERKLLITGGSVHDVFVNGVFHWLDILGCKSILGFDMRSENFQEIPAPDAIRDANLVIDLIAYGDTIALLSGDVEVEQCVDMWVMGRDGLWSKSFSIRLPQRDMWLVCVRNKNELLFILNSERKRKTRGLFLCDISTQKLRKFGPKLHAADSHKLFSFKESLVSIKGEIDNGDFVNHFLK